MEILKTLNKKLAGRVKVNESLAAHTTYKIGGPARYFFDAKNLLDLKKAVLLAKKLRISYFILGRGSNILVSDKGFDGLVIHNKAHQIKVKNDIIIADAGVNLSQLANIAKEHTLAGLEFSAGIPGSLGGAIRGNAGAFGSEIKDMVKKVGVLTEQGKVEKRENSKCEFKYRDSIFKHNQEIILWAELQLKKSIKEMVQQKTEEFLSRKRHTQEFKARSAGCVFKNPKVAMSFRELQLKKLDPKKVNAEGKIPAAYLIDEVGLKGFKVGQVMISDIHSNFIINLGGATCENVVILIGIIKQKVRNKFGIQLQEEIQYVGFNNNS